MREKALSYPSKTFGFYEYSAPMEARQKIHNKNYWVMANPAIGHTWLSIQMQNVSVNVASIELVAIDSSMASKLTV